MRQCHAQNFDGRKVVIVCHTQSKSNMERMAGAGSLRMVYDSGRVA